MLETEIVSRVRPAERTPRQVASEFRRRVDDGLEIVPAGQARDDPEGLLSRGYTPRHEFQLFGVTFYLANLREDYNFRYFVAYVIIAPGGNSSRGPRAYPRIFYKDQSLVWRSPSHCIRTDEDNWIGKGDLKCQTIDGVEIEYSAEETTNLPLEMQSTLDELSRRGGRVRRDDVAVELILRNAPDGRFEPYEDFAGPRRRARADASNLINRGELVARFTRRGDPTSLRFVPGYEPDFGEGVIEISDLKSRLYGGAVRKFRILSKNAQIQYQFVAAPRQVWIIPPQTTTTELTSYGLRTIDVEVDEDLCVPGYEYHFLDESEEPPVLVSQIPEGYVGATSEIDPSRADASPWIEALPVIREFRRRIPLPF